MGLCGAKRVLLSESTKETLTEFFAEIDKNGDKVVSKEEAMKFWGARFAKVNMQNFFAEVDEDRNDAITEEEFLAFWQQVLDQGYEESEILEELENMRQGDAWKKWVKDNKKTAEVEFFEVRNSQSSAEDGTVRLSRRDSKS
ncbi:unnamed protein product [Prorocentrum cordatum]|uniref:EF-hand domain-containing protein n=1 Tax=Prorocentrum cordatum TaxID=2364126 RepID=A0ABN9Y9A9_9DINO|nr:unnamed protein product [Polarella glacialis]|mmetsp:Transcript_24667/g.64977  ORF Transcript_24667/g.64977 Transcript_24667/m.64977 type:complete len:142 (+) Transcript_24667:71-496(+)